MGLERLDASVDISWCVNFNKAIPAFSLLPQRCNGDNIYNIGIRRVILNKMYVVFS